VGRFLPIACPTLVAIASGSRPMPATSSIAIQPENIISAMGIKILDFAWRIADPELRRHASDRTGHRSERPAMAPEQLAAGTSTRANLFAFGVLAGARDRPASFDQPALMLAH
jgi:hypothetical protein